MEQEIEDMNLVLLEGTVISTVNIQDDGNKKAINFALEVQKNSSTGAPKFFKHNVVAFNTLVDRFRDVIKNGSYVRVRGHLIEASLAVGEGEQAKIVVFSKVCADFIEVSN